MVAAFHLYGNRQPRGSMSCPDPVAIPPVVLGVLEVVLKNELVDPVDEIRVSLPRDTAGLNDRYTLPYQPDRPRRPPSAFRRLPTDRTKAGCLLSLRLPVGDDPWIPLVERLDPSTQPIGDALSFLLLVGALERFLPGLRYQESPAPIMDTRCKTEHPYSLVGVLDVADSFPCPGVALQTWNVLPDEDDG